MTEATRPEPSHGRPWWVLRGALVLLSGVSLYLLLPKLLALFSAWPELRNIHPAWFAAAVLFEAMSYLSLWSVQRITLRTPSWFAVGTSQLAGNAVGSLVPGGGATASAFSFRMLIRAGVAPSDVAAGMTASFLATTSAVLALPVLAVPAILGGLVAPRGLVQMAYIGAAAFVGVIAVGSAVLFWDRPLTLAGRAAAWVLARVHRAPTDDLPTRLLAQRDVVRAAFGSRWRVGVLGAVGKWGFDFLALVACLAAVDSRPDPSLALLAYVGASLLGMIPITPGGLGVVEAGLTGLLALAGVPAKPAAVATLAYRLVSYWLPLPCGAVAWALHRRRYGAGPVSVSTTTPP